MGVAALALLALFSPAATQEPPYGPPLPPEIAAAPPPPQDPNAVPLLVEPDPRASQPLADAAHDGPRLTTFLGASLIVVGLLGGGFLLLRKYGRNSRFFPGTGPIQVLSRKALGQKQEIVLVEVGGRVLVVGATRDRLTTLAEMDRPDDVATLRTSLPQRRNESQSLEFRRSLREGIKEHEEPRREQEVYASIAEELADMRRTVKAWRA